MAEEEEPMVGAKRITEEFDVPRGSLYAMVKDGRIPAHDVTKPWHKRRQWGFKVSEVRAALDALSRPGDARPAP